MKTIVATMGSLDEKYKASYELLSTELQRHDCTLFVSMPPDEYQGDSTFSGGLRVRTGAWERIESPIVADIIFNKSMLHLDDDTAWIINNPALTRACTKDETFRHFPDHMPRSIVVRSADQLSPAIKRLRTDIVVVKPTDNYGGEGVWIGKKSDMPDVMAFPVIVQEFIDSSAGIPGVCEGKHDLRLMFFGGRFIDAYLRQPAEGKFLSNVAQGGVISQIPADRVPKEAIAFGHSIDHAFSSFPDRVYSVDMALDRDGQWRLIELNAPAGLPTVEDDAGTHIPALAAHLATTARTQHPIIGAPSEISAYTPR